MRLVLDSGRAAEATPALLDELLVEGALAVIRTRLDAGEGGLPATLPEELMAVVLHAYAGRPGGAGALPALAPGQLVSAPAPSEVPPRMTYRTLRVLSALAESPGATNRRAGEAAGITDQGQISRLLRRLSTQGLVRNEGESRNGAPKHWHLTERGLVLQRQGRRDLERRGAGAPPSPQTWLPAARKNGMPPDV